MRTHLHLITQGKKSLDIVKRLGDQLLRHSMTLGVEEPDVAAGVVQFLSKRLPHLE